MTKQQRSKPITGQTLYVLDLLGRGPSGLEQCIAEEFILEWMDWS
jgi:hypothetical protein